MKRQRKNLKLLPESISTIQEISSNEKVKKALEQIALQEPYTIEEQIEICEVAAPPMNEYRRAEVVRDKMRDYGLKAEFDSVGNVIGRYRGSDPEAPVCVVAAHLDTIFDEDVDVTVTRKGGKLYAPGISDNARGVACILQVIRSLVRNRIKTRGDILFVATVGEEAEGDLRGTKKLFKSSGIHIDGMITVESADPGTLLWGSTGSKRFKIEYMGPGGHSYFNFGEYPSATHALCRAGALLSDHKVPTEPKTTFSIGTMKGGSSVNSIAEYAECELDLRSQDNKVLDDLVEEVIPLFAKGAALENESCNVTEDSLKVKCKITPLGHRPAGELKDENPVLQAAHAAQTALGIELTNYTTASNDQNIPMSMGIPATTIGGGGRAGFSHALNEWYQPYKSQQGPQLCLLTVLALVGLSEGPQPMLKIFGNN